MEHEEASDANCFTTVSEVLEQGVEELKIRVRIKTMQTTALLRAVRIIIRILET